MPRLFLNEPLLCKHRHGLWHSSQMMSTSEHCAGTWPMPPPTRAGPGGFLPKFTVVGMKGRRLTERAVPRIKGAVEMWLSLRVRGFVLQPPLSGPQVFRGLNEKRSSLPGLL